MSANQFQVAIPYHVRRAIGKYRGEFQRAITELVAEKLRGAGTIRPEEIGECAANVIFGQSQPDALSQVEVVAMKAYHAGKFRFLDDVIRELRNELENSAA